MYPSDLSDAQWARLEPLLRQHRGSPHAGLWERAGRALREEGRRAAGRKATPTVAIIDGEGRPLNV